MLLLWDTYVELTALQGFRNPLCLRSPPESGLSALQHSLLKDASRREEIGTLLNPQSLIDQAS